MADPGRLDELKRKFDENPRRYFAPLANEYRKGGDLDRAIELCRTYLPQQPTHMSGYIVYGQALADAGRADEATAVFQQALSLDPENIIALRYLGDIARQGGDERTAMRWYGKVLELDPRNEEIAAFITQLAGPRGERRTGPERPVPPTIRPEPEPDPEPVALEDILSEPDLPPSTVRRTIEYVAVSRTVVEESTPAEVPAPGAAELDAEAAAPDDERATGSTDADDHKPGVASPFVTETMAELYVAQGMPGEAAQIYRELASRSGDDRLRARADELEREPAGPAERTGSEDSEARSGGGVSGSASQPEAESQPESGESQAARSAEPEPAEPVTSGGGAAMAGGAGAVDASPSGAGIAGARRETVREFFARIGDVRPGAHPHIAAEGAAGLGQLFDAGSVDPADLSAAQSLAGAFATGGEHQSH